MAIYYVSLKQCLIHYLNPHIKFTVVKHMRTLTTVAGFQFTFQQWDHLVYAHLTHVFSESLQPDCPAYVFYEITTCVLH